MYSAGSNNKEKKNNPKITRLKKTTASYNHTHQKSDINLSATKRLEVQKQTESTLEQQNGQNDCSDS